MLFRSHTHTHTFMHGEAAIIPATVVKLGFQGRVRVEKGSGWKAFQSRKSCSEVEVRRCAPAGVLPPAHVLLAWAAVVLLQESNVIGALLTHSREKTTSTHCGTCPKPSSVYSLGYCVQTPSQKPIPECTHSSLNKLGYLIHLLVYLFWLHLKVCGILVPWSGIEPRVLGSESRVLTSGPPGNSHIIALIINYLMF